MKNNKKKASHKKIVYTYGVFDLIHTGHVGLLRDAKKLGNYLIVGVFTDEVAESFKRQPIINQQMRMAMVDALKVVDKVVSQTSFDPSANIKKYKPHIVTKGPGASWDIGKVPDFAGFKNVKVKVLDYHAGISTSKIIEKIKNS